MQFTTTAIDGVLIIQPRAFGDARGHLAESFKQSLFEKHGVSHAWPQDNHSVSAKRGTLRGLHFQKPPHAQAKLIRVVSGAVFDVVVDVRRSSPTYGRAVGAELSADNLTMLYAPAGMAHGFITLTDNAVVHYKCSAEYNKDAEGGLNWQDPACAALWPIRAADAVINERDAAFPMLIDLETAFP